MEPTNHDLTKRKSPVPVAGGVKRAGLVGALVGMLALDWLALDDITTGVESSWFLEGLVLVVSVPVITVLAKQIFGRSREES